MHKTSACAAVVLALTLTLSACGSDDPSTDTTTEMSTTEHNDADVAFATDMIQHHAQALSMVDLTLDRPLDPAVTALAEDIRAAQAPEIETMADWLTTWGEEVPETMRDHVNSGHDMGDMSDMSDNMDDMDHGDEMPGMMTAEDMDALENASATEFQDMWLDRMIEHHTGAIAMAETEQSEGRFKDAVDLAGQVVEGQSEEMDTMQGLLDS